MTGFEIKMDGVKYFVTVEDSDFGVTSSLYLDTMRSAPIWQEDFMEKESKWNVKRVKKFIKNVLSKHA